MEIFGSEWKNHDKKLQKNWNNLVLDQDTVLVPGDISWGIKIENARLDLNFINKNLKGKKIFIKGNHDYWWHAVTRLNDEFENIYFLQNKATCAENFIITGSRGWLCPDDKNFKPSIDKKIYDRELIRLEMSLKEGRKFKEKNPKMKLISIIHFPPTSEQKEKSGFTELFEKYNVKKVFYGHLHTKEGYNRSIQGEFNGVLYSLVSCDYLKFMPLKIK